MSCHKHFFTFGGCRQTNINIYIDVTITKSLHKNMFIEQLFRCTKFAFNNPMAI